MKIWQCSFNGRFKNALGVTYPKNTYCLGETEEEARLFLYTAYEQVKNFKAEPAKDNAFKISSIDKEIIIVWYTKDSNGWHLQKGALIDSPLELISDPIKRQLIMLEANDGQKPISKRRYVELTTDIGRTWKTEINGTLLEIGKYFLGQQFEYNESLPVDKVIKINFLNT